MSIKKIVWHGSVMRITKPEFGGGKPYNDYGLGFYCTEIRDLAKEWAVRRESDGFANSYEIEMDGMRILKLNDEPYGIMHWLSVLLKNRQFEVSEGLPERARSYILQEFPVNEDDFDIVIGYRADDSYFSFAQDFLNNLISYQQLSKAMRLGKLGEQIVIKSKRAFEALKFLDAESALREDWLEKKLSRDSEARRLYREVVRREAEKGALYVNRIVDERISADDPILR